MKIRERYGGGHDELWASIKRRRFLKARDKYQFDGQFRALVNGKKFIKRRFDNEHDECGFAEYFNEYGVLEYIDFFKDASDIVIRMKISVNPAQWHGFNLSIF